MCLFQYSFVYRYKYDAHQPTGTVLYPAREMATQALFFIHEWGSLMDEQTTREATTDQAGRRGYEVTKKKNEGTPVEVIRFLSKEKWW